MKKQHMFDDQFNPPEEELIANTIRCDCCGRAIEYEEEYVVVNGYGQFCLDCIDFKQN